MDNRRIDRLGGSFSITTTKRHSFGTDAVLLADFAKPANGDKVCDLGTGCGIIPMLFSVWGIDAHTDAVDIQQDAISLLSETVQRNNLSSKINPVCCDLKRLKGVLPHGEYDLITCNPPYRKLQSGIACKDDGLKIARFEVCANIYDICLEAFKLLKIGGRFCLCNRPDRLTDTMDALGKVGFAAKALRMVQQRYNTEAWLFLLEAVKCGKNSLRIMPALIIENEAGKYTDDVKDIYGEFALGHL